MNAKETNVSKHYKNGNYVSFYKNGIFFYCRTSYSMREECEVSKGYIGIY